MPQPTDLAADIVRRYALTPADLVVEVGGDGSLLHAVQALGPRVLGVQPDIAAMLDAFHAGADGLAAVFGPAAADYVRRRSGPARVLVVRPPRADLVAVAARCLAPGGVVLVEAAGGQLMEWRAAAAAA